MYEKYWLPGSDNMHFCIYTLMFWRYTVFPSSGYQCESAIMIEALSSSKMVARSHKTAHCHIQKTIMFSHHILICIPEKTSKNELLHISQCRQNPSRSKMSYITVSFHHNFIRVSIIASIPRFSLLLYTSCM